MISKPYAESCDQNREPIKQILAQFVEGNQTLLEVGSGTGQHAVYLAQSFPWLSWQTSELLENHAGIQAWIDDSGLANIQPPLELDANQQWPQQRYDVLFTANTIHIMSERSVMAFFENCPNCMHEQSSLLMYGPFNYQNEYTSDSNARFDDWLKQRDSMSGIKNFEWLCELGEKSGLHCTHDFEMPANNRILVWHKSSTINRT